MTRRSAAAPLAAYLLHRYDWSESSLIVELFTRERGRVAAAAFEYHLEDNLIDLQDDLTGGTYTPGAYASFTIHEPKRRLILDFSQFRLQ